MGKLSLYLSLLNCFIIFSKFSRRKFEKRLSNTFLKICIYIFITLDVLVMLNDMIAFLFPTTNINNLDNNTHFIALLIYYLSNTPSCPKACMVFQFASVAL